MTTAERYNNRICELAMQQAKWGNRAQVVAWAKHLEKALKLQA